MESSTTKAKGKISGFIEKHFLHFNAASLVDAAQGYEAQLAQGSKMLVSLAGAMSTAELGKIFSEIIRTEKVHIIIMYGSQSRRGYHELGGPFLLQKGTQLSGFDPTGRMGPVAKWA